MTPRKSHKNSKIPGATLGLFLYSGFFTLTILILFSGCTAVPVDYTAYTNFNLIEGEQLNSANWVAEEAAGPNMRFQQVCDPAGANGSADGWAGYLGGNDAALRGGGNPLPSLPDGSKPAIYRLETLNLMPNGDLEGGLQPVRAVNPITGTITLIIGAVTLNPPHLEVIYNTNDTGWYELSTIGTDKFGFNLSQLTAWQIGNKYTLSFIYLLADSPSKLFGLDNLAMTANQYSFGVINNASPGNLWRFPFRVPGTSGSSILPTSTTGPLDHLWFNTSSNKYISDRDKPFSGAIDDIQVISSTKTNAIRLQIPLNSATRPQQPLQAGGTYTVKVWIRRDLTSTYSGTASHTNNRFDADFLAISLSGTTSVQSRGMGALATNQIPVWHDFPASGAGSWEQWTEISASLHGPATLPASLALSISTTNMDSNTYRSPGSILIANPRLYWSPN